MESFSDVRFHQLSSSATSFLISGRENSLLLSAHVIEEGNGTPLQYSCLENPMGGGGG